MKQRTLIIHPDDNLIVALTDLAAGETIRIGDDVIKLQEAIPQKHKFNKYPVSEGQELRMYGVTVGTALVDLPAGMRISRENTVHKASQYSLTPGTITWQAPDVAHLRDLTWQGYHRSNGKVGTRNYWLVIPLVFCENRNVNVMRESLLRQLGYLSEHDFVIDVGTLMDQYRQGASAEQLRATEIVHTREKAAKNKLFPHVDGIKFLTHEGGCGGTRDDVQALCNLLAGYVTHPNVGGATILSLGCQMAQTEMLKAAVAQIDPNFNKPLEIFDQQKSTSERAMLADAVKATFIGLSKINQLERSTAQVRDLCLGLECGGSDGFSGISANPALGHASDLIVALGGSTILSEFPELNGVEQELINRCVDLPTAEKFTHLMRTYAGRAKAVGSGFDMNPSPGNIRDGLITDAMKSAGASRKGGSSPIAGVLDYTEQVTKPGLHLLCTPGNDVESTTALAGSGANLIAFTTGLGTPTGNPVAPTAKISSNTALAQRMSEIIDIDTGPIIEGDTTVAQKGEEILRYLLEVASGKTETKAEKLGQDDFIPWKRGVSL